MSSSESDEEAYLREEFGEERVQETSNGEASPNSPSSKLGHSDHMSNTKKKGMGNKITDFFHTDNDNNHRDKGKAEEVKKRKRGNSRDSTSDPDSEDEVRGESKKRQERPMYSQWSDADTQDYREGYPGKKDNPKLQENLLFYLNKTTSRPEGLKIDDIHRKWKGNYDLLERHHGYIQWLFPIRESGMNWQAQELQMHEIKAIMADEAACGRILTSYRMMLDFYGMKLADSGKITKTPNWPARSRHLNRSFHNYLRITRILKCLGEFGHENLKVPFLRFVVDEAETLPNCIDSLRSYWVMTIKDDAERKKLYEQAKQLEKKPSRWI